MAVRLAKEFLDELMTEHPEVRAEYERLGPRYAVIEEVIRARRRAKLSQRELAERMGVKQPVVGRLESGRHDPRLDTIVRAAEALGCDVEIKFKRRHRGSGAATAAVA